MVKDYLAELALDVGKDKIKDKFDEKALKVILSKYIERHQKYNEVCTLAEEIDFQGLVEYIQRNLLNSVSNRLFAPSKKERGQARESIIAAAITYSKAGTVQARQNVVRCISDCLDIICGFYSLKIPRYAYILASETVDAIEERTQEIVDSSKEEILSKVDSIEDNLKNGSLFSINKAIQLTEMGNFPEIESGFKKVLDHISLEHPLHPHYGYTFSDKKLQSEPLTQKAKELYPPRYVLTGAVRFGDTYYNNPDGDPLGYSYRHQIPIAMEVSKAVKYLGDKLDPIQSEVEGLPGKTILAASPKFPPAFPCSIKVGDVVFFNFILFRTQEILEDGTYIIGNKEQGLHIYFEIQINPQKSNKPNFIINMNCSDNHEMLNYARFMKSLPEGGTIHIYALETKCDFIAGYINGWTYKTGFASVDEEIDFLERVCAIEDHFSVKLNLSGKISEEAYDKVLYVSDLIKNGNVSTTWNEMTCTGTLDHRLREELVKKGPTFYMLSYVGICEIGMFGISVEFRLMRTFKCACIVDYEKVKKKAEVLEDGDTINIAFRAGEDNSVIDTLNIPDELLV